MGSMAISVYVRTTVHGICSTVSQEPIVFDKNGHGKGSVSFACTKNAPFALLFGGGEICDASGKCIDYFIFTDQELKNKWEVVRGKGKGFTDVNILTYRIYAYAKDISSLSSESLTSLADVVLEY